MDAARLAAVTHSFGLATARRAALGGALGAGLVALLSRSRTDDAAAKQKRRKKKRCKGSTKRCGKQCRNLLTDSANCGACGNDCDGFPCIHGACACKGLGGCPDTCDCVARTEGFNACIGGVSSDPCTVDSDCPAGAVCLSVNVCSERCTGIPDEKE